jgi:hypothetical protein
MRKYFSILILILIIIPIQLISQTAKLTYRVKYISNENVYLDAGSSEGLGIGDRLVIKRGETGIAGLEIIFVADHSSSCKVLVSKEIIKVGDIAEVVKKMSVEQETTQKTVIRKRAIPSNTKNYSQHKPFVRMSGYASILWYHVEDLSPAHRHFDQPTFRLNLKMDELWGKDLNFQLRTRSRYYQRIGGYTSGKPSEDWQNRMYECSFEYDNSESFLNFKLGRIISNKFSGVGYIDGGLLQVNCSSAFRFGAFGGNQPEWGYADFQTSLQKYGFYFNYIQGNYRTSRFEMTLAGAGEYHGPTVSREFIYIQNNFYGGNRWSLYQSAELDVNRKWRKDLANENVSLTNLYVSGNLNVTNWLSTSLTYDNRKNYFTYEIRSLADTLFDDALRYGYQASFNLKPIKDFTINATLGFRKRQPYNENTYSYAAGLNKNNFIMDRLSLNLYFSSFSNYFARGYNPTLSIRKYFLSGHSINLSYGNYSYQLKSMNQNRNNQWLRLNCDLNLISRFYLSAEYGHNWGDDMQDHRMVAEIGYRF